MVECLSERVPKIGTRNTKDELLSTDKQNLDMYKWEELAASAAIRSFPWKLACEKFVCHKSPQTVYNILLTNRAVLWATAGGTCSLSSRPPRIPISMPPFMASGQCWWRRTHVSVTGVTSHEDAVVLRV